MSAPLSAAPVARPRSAQSLVATVALSPVMTLTVTPRSARRRNAVTASGLGGSRKTRKPTRSRSTSSAAVTAVAAAAVRVATAMTRCPAANSASIASDSAGEMARQRLMTASGAPLTTRVSSLVRMSRTSTEFIARSWSNGRAARRSNAAEIGHERARRRRRHQGRVERVSARRVERAGAAVEWVNARGKRGGGRVERMRDSSCDRVQADVGCVGAGRCQRRRPADRSGGCRSDCRAVRSEESPAQDVGGAQSVSTDRPHETDLPDGEGAGLVGEENIDVAEVLDADQSLHQDLARSQPARTGGEAGCHDGGQQLWGDADGDGEREQDARRGVDGATRR